jgi:ABC-type Fe3+-hydroxamate transport system substrate-binding protein
MQPPAPGLAPATIVSLVPSTTDSLITLGFADRVIGITDYCPWPAGLPPIKRMGGPKDADPDRIAQLQPALVIANQEDNSKTLVDELQARGVSVWVAYPRSVPDALTDLFAIAGLYPSLSAYQQVQWLERALHWLTATPPHGRIKIFCPIWRNGPLDRASPWKTLARDTYAADLLSLCGADVCVPNAPEGRYPEVGLDLVRAFAPDAVLLPNEPFPFEETDADWFRRELELPIERVCCWDGRDLFWHGTRLGHALQMLPDWIRSFAT